MQPNSVWVNYEIHWPYKREKSFRQSTSIFYGDNDPVEMFYDGFDCAKYVRGIINFDNIDEAEMWAYSYFGKLSNDSWLNSDPPYCQARSAQVPPMSITKSHPTKSPSKVQPRRQTSMTRAYIKPRRRSSDIFPSTRMDSGYGATKSI